MDDKYLPRIADKKLELSLNTSGAVLIVGPKWCGKTRTAEEISKSVLYMQDPDHTAEYKYFRTQKTVCYRRSAGMEPTFAIQKGH